MGEPGVCIVSLGASTPLGRTAWASAAAVRAGISGFGQHPFMIDTAGEPMHVARAPWLDIELSGMERFEALLFPALDEALRPLTDQAERLPKVALALGLPAPRPGLPINLEPAIRSSIGRRYGTAFSAMAPFPKGHAAGLLALDAVYQKLKQRVYDACLVAGVDSYLEPETLEWLEESDQLHGAGPLNNAWGFIPGEAAGAILLMPQGAAKEYGFQPLAQLLGVGTGIEQNRIKTDTVCIGEGLTQAFRRALVGLPDNTKVTDVYCDMNGEPYRADEFGFSCLRTKEAFESASEFIAPADCWGDVAAASGPLSIGLAAIAGAKSYAKGPRAFVWASSEGGERAATLIEMQQAASA